MSRPFHPLAALTLALASACSPRASAELAPSGLDKAVILSMTSCKENSTTRLVYDYAEALGPEDGRGITFGIIGFTSGTYDGTMLLKRLKSIDPAHPLLAYLPAFEAIDALPHPEGKTNETPGLERFIADFEARGADEPVKRAQLAELDALYWDPALEIARKVGARNMITLQALYDCAVNQGVGGGDGEMGLELLVEAASRASPPPSRGGDELAWLESFLKARWRYMSKDPWWRHDKDRIDMTRAQMKAGNYSLKPGFQVEVNEETFVVDGAGVY